MTKCSLYKVGQEQNAHSHFLLECVGCKQPYCTKHLKLLTDDLPICSYCYCENVE